MRPILAVAALTLVVGCSASVETVIPAAQTDRLSGPSPSPSAPAAHQPDRERSASAQMSEPLLEPEPAPDPDGDPFADPGDPFYRPPGLDPCEPNEYGFEDNDACLQQHGY
ncbi:hypothetical protein FZ103_10320 [Streptomonospora sp. PA3]|uniref:hypothetical protein n=1 Tax=Streptomonospora sp. PA3 TaxID=2607326 RepID=UPI0012DFCB93|nr:hypothetical protein [Streptomonospora sp. PA3]MUL41566.1 hypothetical protein [Streptomonospora sp. PA3]